MLISEYLDEIGIKLGLEKGKVSITHKGVPLVGYENFTFVKNTTSSTFVIMGDVRVIASFSLGQLYGCCGVCVSFHSVVYNTCTKRGIGTLLNLMRIDITTYLEYGLLLCTDGETNTPQKRILEKNGWETIYKFKNPRTANMLKIDVIPLNNDRKGD